MSQKARIIKSSKPEALPGDVTELGKAIESLPAEHRQRLEGVFFRVAESTRRRRRIMSLVQDALGQLRLDTKYLVFDLEATRRERDDYRRQLEGA